MTELDLKTKELELKELELKIRQKECDNNFIIEFLKFINQHESISAIDLLYNPREDKSAFELAVLEFKNVFPILKSFNEADN